VFAKGGEFSLPGSCVGVGGSEGIRNEDPGRALIEELLGTAFALMDVMSSLIEDMPEDAYPGENNAAVMLEMVIGSCRPAFEAAGEENCRSAVALVGAVRDRVFDDLRTAAELTRARRGD
jgi:hypothetical protein